MLLLLQDDEGIGDELQLSTVVLSYGYVAAYAPPESLLSRVDVYMLHNTMPLLQKARSHLFRLTAVSAIELMARSLQLDRLPEGKRNFKLTQRDELLLNLVLLLPAAAQPDDKLQPQRGKDVKVSAELRLSALQCAATLLRLPPPLHAELRTKLLQAVLPFFSLTDAQLAEDGREKRKEDEALLTLERRDEPTAEQLVTQLNALLAALVQTDAQLSTTLDSLKLLEPYLVSPRVLERQRASASFLVLLKEFIRGCLGEERVRREETSLPQLGLFVSMVLPRVLDSDAEVRGSGLEGVQALLYVSQLLSNPDQPKPSQEVKLITDCKQRLQQTQQPARLEAADDLAGVLVTLLPVSETSRLLSGLFTAFLDADSDAALGAAFLWSRLVHLQGRLLASDVRPLLSGVLQAARQCKQREVLELAFSGLRELGGLHFTAVAAQLLEPTVPLPKEAVDLLCALVADGASSPLPARFVEHLCALLNDTPVDKEKPPAVVATGTAALREICKVEALRPVLLSAYCPLACTLLMRIGMCNDVDAAGTADAIAALRAFLTQAGDADMQAELEAADVWKTLSSSAQYDDGVTLACRALCTHHAELRPALLSFLSKFLSQQSYTGQRIVATAMLAELVTHSAAPAAAAAAPASAAVTGGEAPAAAGSPAASPSPSAAAAPNPLLREVIKYLLPRVADKVEKVRKHALRGLGNLVTVWSEETAEMATSILSSLISASEDTDSEVAGEAVASLTRIVGVVGEATMAPMLISVCWRLRPAFERREDNVRASAFTLFGGLCRFGSGAGDARDFLDQLHVNLPIFVVHLNDESAAVRAAAHAGLRQLAALLDPAIASIVADSPAEPAAYDELVYRLCPLLASLYGQHVRGYIDSSAAYFSSRWQELRGASALLACLLLANCSEAVRKSITVSALVSGLLKLLDEPNAAVRSKAVKGLTYLHDV